jgi:EAL and modified HD-GYP domain-containing signal transduction protein
MSSSEAPLLQDIFVGRQPIYTRRLELYAYELLYRGGDVDFADFTEGDRATSQVLLNTFTEFGIERVVGGHLAFVNLTRGFIIGEYPLPVPRTQVVLEVLEDVEPDEEVIAGLKELRRKGFRVALDDFVYREEFEPMLALADIVKVDVLGMSEDEIRAHYSMLRPYGAKLLAEKIETRAVFETCLETGFDYFQGFFLAKPNVVVGTSVPPTRLNLLRLLAEIQSPACDFKRVQEIVAQDVTLSYKLLRHINAVVYGMPRRIDSIQETVVYLGLTTVKNIACLSLLSDMQDTPHDLVTTAMLRAKMCELLAAAGGERETHPYFTVGLFSALDAIMNTSMNTVLSRLPLTDELRAALLAGEGKIGEALKTTIAYERGEWGDVGCFGLSRAQIKQAFVDAVEWSEKIDVELSRIAA